MGQLDVAKTSGLLVIGALVVLAGIRKGLGPLSATVG